MVDVDVYVDLSQVSGRRTNDSSRDEYIDGWGGTLSCMNVW